jgi:hypothetical protein
MVLAVALKYLQVRAAAVSNSVVLRVVPKV